MDPGLFHDSVRRGKVLDESLETNNMARAVQDDENTGHDNEQPGCVTVSDIPAYGADMIDILYTITRILRWRVSVYTL